MNNPPNNSPEQTSSLAFENYTATRSSKSSSARGWQGLLVRTFAEPDSIEYNFAPGTPDAFISLIISGEAQIACRTDVANGRKLRFILAAFISKPQAYPVNGDGCARLKTH
jgi:hypothetical protein